MSFKTIKAQPQVANIGDVTELKGQAQIIRDDAFQAALDFDVQQNDLVETNVGRIGITFLDDSVVRLTEHSKLTIDEYVYDPNRMTILPRAYSSQANHIDNYRRWMNLNANETPNFADNLEFMFRYQLGYMYMRYFLWNFAGRESDIQGADWLSPLDSFKEVPQQLKENKGRNNLFMLPLLLGLLGLFFNYRKSQQIFSIIILLFFMLGMALVLYLNSPPVEPRERDYIYVGSFYAYAIWIGLGVMALYQLLLRIIKNNKAAIAIAFCIGMVIPVILAIENWDDHDRSDRYFSVDSAKNFLDSCEPNAILFTGGDNDTFPLWYAQEVEGFRTDVRVIVLSYFNTDWYIDQMTRQAYESESLPFGLDPKLYRQGGPNDYLPYIENPTIGQQAINLDTYMRLVRQDRKEIKVPTSLSSYNSLPSKSLYMMLNKEDILTKGIIPEGMEDDIPGQMVFRVKKNGIEKNTLMILDLITNNNWERPIYFNNTSLQGVGVDVNPYVVQEGNAYRLLPIQNPKPGESYVNTEIMYRNVMEKFSFREMNNLRTKPARLLHKVLNLPTIILYRAAHRKLTGSNLQNTVSHNNLLLKTKRLIKAKHYIHILHRLAGCTFDKIIDS